MLHIILCNTDFCQRHRSDCYPVVLYTHHFPHVRSSDPTASDVARSVNWSNWKLTGKKKSFLADCHQKGHPAALLYHHLRGWGRKSSTQSKENPPFLAAAHSSTGVKTNKTTPKNVLLQNKVFTDWCERLLFKMQNTCGKRSKIYFDTQISN